jgi:type I restriction enzyme S subunit
MGVKEASATYRVLDEVALAGEGVPPGFKRTDVGLIPQDWQVLPFSQLFQRLNGKGHQVLATDYQASGQLPVVDQGQELVAGWTDRLEKRFSCPAGGVIVFGDHTRVVKYVSVDFAVGADGTQLLVGRDQSSTRFLAYQLQATEIPSAGYSRHFKFLAESQFASPPSECERTGIAETLADADALIESLQQLIAKKRALKQGAMQVLLTGRQRLPGFSGEWKSKPLSELFRFSGGFSASRAQLGQDGHLYLHYGDIHGASSCRLDICTGASRIPRIEIPLASVSRDSMLEDADVVFVDASED